MRIEKFLREVGWGRDKSRGGCDKYVFYLRVEGRSEAVMFANVGNGGF